MKSESVTRLGGLPSVEARLRGAMWGLLVGDAIGVPFELLEPGELPPVDEIGPLLPIGFQRAHGDAPVGAWSDDGAQALCLAESLARCGELDTHDLILRMVRWSEEGRLAVERVVFDIGFTTANALRTFSAGEEPESCGPRHERSNGNGSLMRVLPLALWHKGTDEELVRDAMRQSCTTHGHIRSQLACAQYCLLARQLLRRPPSSGETMAVQVEAAWKGAGNTLLGLSREREEWVADLRVILGSDAPERGGGSAYVVDSLLSARWALQTTSYASTVQRAVSLGYDTDTTASVAGGIAGLCLGESAIPKLWLEHLAGREIAAPVIEVLLKASLRV